MIFAQLNCVLVDADATNRQELASYLADHGAVITAMLPALDALPALLRQPETIHLVLVNLDPNARQSLHELGPLIREFSGSSFFVMSEKVDAELLMEVIHLGAKEFIPLPMRPERLLASIERIAQANSGAQQQAKIIQIVPAAGGCGATSVACNVAATLARQAKTVLIDLDLVCGAVATNFNLNPRYTIADVMISGGTLDRNLVTNALAVDPNTNLHVLARPEHQEDSQRVTRAGLTRLLGVLSRLFEYIVIDSRMSGDPVYLAATQAADTSVLVMELNVPAARNAERFIGTLKRLGIDTHKVKVIVNRFEKRGSDIKPSDLEKTLGLKVAWTIPNDFRNAIGAINFGQPVVVRSPRAEIAGSIAGLADMLNGRNGRG
jgi:pilus assembly protein CpaE